MKPALLLLLLLLLLLHLLVLLQLCAARFAHREEKTLSKLMGLSKITLSGANRWHVSTHQQQKSLSVPKSQATDAQTPLTGTAAPSSAPRKSLSRDPLLPPLRFPHKNTQLYALDKFPAQLYSLFFLATFLIFFQGGRKFCHPPLRYFSFSPPPQHLVE